MKLGRERREHPVERAVHHQHRDGGDLGHRLGRRRHHASSGQVCSSALCVVTQ
jgi:hypothetical protein